jgi:hypothetical protein
LDGSGLNSRGLDSSGLDSGGLGRSGLGRSGPDGGGLDSAGAPTRSGDDDPRAPGSSLPAELLLENPASAQCWLRLGQFLLAENQLHKAQYCIERAAALAPRSPPLLLEAAAFLHATGHSSRAYELMSRVLAATRDYDQVIFALYGRSTDVATVLLRGLPRDPRASHSYLLHLLGERDSAAARLAWDWLSRHQFADRAVVRRYLLYLFAESLYDEAARVFENWLPAGERPSGGNRITHGGFEAEPSGVPLDWTVLPNPHATVRRDRATAHEGSWSLRIEFDGEANLEYRHVAQQAVVQPGRWKLQAWIRTEAITSDQGVGLRVFEARPAPEWQAWSGDVSGDAEWRPLEITVTIPPAVRLVQVEIVRRPSRKLDAKIGGVAWIDAVSLTPVGPETSLRGLH